MYSVLIADDEDLIRQGFEEFVPWNELGFQVICTCENGNQVIDFIEKNHVDLILTDIIMVDTTGLDIAKYVYKHGLDTTVCLVSGHRNFEYARTAMKYNVKYYLTKPTDFDDMFQTIKEIKEDLDSRAKPAEDIHALRQQFFTDLLTGSKTYNDRLNIYAEELGIDLKNQAIFPFWIKVNDFDKYIEEKWDYGKELVLTAISELFQDGIKPIEMYNIFTNDSEAMYLGVYSLSEFSEFSAIADVMNKARENTSLLTGVSISCQTEKSFKSLENLCGLLSSAIDSSANNTNPLQTSHNNIILLELYKNLLFALVLGNCEKTDSIFELIYKAIAHLDIDSFREYIMHILSILTEKLQNAGFPIKPDEINELTEAINTEPARDRIITLVKELLLKTVTGKSSNDALSDNMIEKVKDYINNHYMDNISLFDAANYVFLNASYLSRLFKQYTGENFRDYLINIRISKACELIGQHKYKIYEISEMCGYRNPKYFTHQFRQVTGLSPREYASKSD